MGEWHSFSVAKESELVLEIEALQAENRRLNAIIAAKNAGSIQRHYVLAGVAYSGEAYLAYRSQKVVTESMPGDAAFMLGFDAGKASK